MLYKLTDWGISCATLLTHCHYTLWIMAGSKRNKIKKLLSTHTPVIDDDDEELVNDLLAQLEASQDPVVQKETASVVQTMHLDERAHVLESSRKQDPKARFKARQVSVRVPCNHDLT